MNGTGAGEGAEERGKLEEASHDTVREIVSMHVGIDTDTARKMVKDIKGLGLKVQAQIMDNKLRITGKKIDPAGDWDGVVDGSGLLAARSRPGPGVHQAVLRREHDTFCITVMREPAPTEGIGWAQLDQQWTDAAGQASPAMR